MFFQSFSYVIKNTKRTIAKNNRPLLLRNRPIRPYTLGNLVGWLDGVTKMRNVEVSQKRTEIGSDWHRADVVAALKKIGTSVSKLSRESGLASATLQNTLRAPWPKGERIIADALGVEPQDIWPSRYQPLFKKAS